MRTLQPLLAGLVLLNPSLALALGEETFGSEPLNAANYAEWPGIMPVVNHPSRVYRTWVNGNEHFYYSGNAEELNDVLQKFSEVESKTLDVILRPGPCETQTFDGQAVPYHWKPQLVGGIARHMTRQDKGENVWSPHPVLTVCIGDKIPLDELRIPKSLKVTGLHELKGRYAKALDSKDQTVRGWGAGELAALDPYDRQSAAEIAELLEDEVDWVRLNAAGALALFGERAEAELPEMRAARDTDNQQLKERIDTAIEAVQDLKRPPAVYREYEQRMKQILEYLKGRG